MIKIKSLLLIVFMILISSIVFSDVCQDQQLMGVPCYDTVRLLSSCNYVDVYDSNLTFYTQFLLTYLHGYYYYNYTIDNLDEIGNYYLNFCDGQTYSYIEMISNDIPFYMRLNSTFLRDNDKLAINYYVNITNDTILQTNFTLSVPNGTIYFEEDLVPNNSINGTYFYNNTFLSTVAIGYWEAKLSIVGVNYSYTTIETFKVNSNNKTLPFCDVTNITYTYEIPQYCDLNSNCYVFFTPDLSRNISLSATAYLISNGTAYNMFYSNSNNYWYSIIKTSQSEDLSLNLFAYYDDGSQTVCSQQQSGTIKFRKAYDVDIRLYVDGLLNSTRHYTSDFDYLYLIYTNDSSVSSNAMVTSLNDANNVLSTINKINQKVYKFSMGTQGVLPQFSTYFWGKYNNGVATIRLYETGIYDLYVVNSNSNLNTSYKQFNRPARDDTISYENKLFTGIYLNETTTWNLKTTVYAIDWMGILIKIGITLLIILGFLVLHAIVYGICELVGHGFGMHISGLLCFITIPLAIMLVIINWW